MRGPKVTRLTRTRPRVARSVCRRAPSRSPRPCAAESDGKSASVSDRETSDAGVASDRAAANEPASTRSQYWAPTMLSWRKPPVATLLTSVSHRKPRISARTSGARRPSPVAGRGQLDDGVDAVAGGQRQEQPGGRVGDQDDGEAGQRDGRRDDVPDGGPHDLAGAEEEAAHVDVARVGHGEDAGEHRLGQPTAPAPGRRRRRCPARGRPWPRASGARGSRDLADLRPGRRPRAPGPRAWSPPSRWRSARAGWRRARARCRR